MSSNFMRRIGINLDIEQIVGVWNWWRDLSGFSIPKNIFNNYKEKWVHNEFAPNKGTQASQGSCLDTLWVKTKFHKIFEINLNFCLYKCIENAKICTTKRSYFLVVQIAIKITFICNVGGILCPPIALFHCINEEPKRRSNL
jgi:hypothetical protein